MRMIEDAAGVVGREVIPRVITPANPAAGAEIVIKVPGGVTWLVQSMRATFVASAAVATRFAVLQITDGSTVLVDVIPANNVTATQSYKHNWMPFIGYSSSASLVLTQVIPFPFRQLFGGWQVQTTTALIDVGDQWTGVTMHVLEISELPYDEELAQDVAALRRSFSNAFPQVSEGI